MIPRGSGRGRGALSLAVAGVLLAGCAADELAAPAPAPLAATAVVVPEPTREITAGLELRVGIPAAPTGWVVPEGDDLAAQDLAALWGLPLYRVDEHGRTVPALARDAQVSADGRQVTIRLRAGEWSDGAPVTAADVVATVDALRGSGLGHELDVVDAAEVVDEATVRLQLRQPTIRWPLLLGTTGVLPAHVLADGGLERFADDLPVTGGPFRLLDEVSGLSARFAAHPGSPLGPPRAEELEVVVVPSYDVALRLLADGDLDAAVGHLALAAETRAQRLELAAAAPVGGSWVGLDWRRDGALGEDDAVRRAVAAATNVGEHVSGLRTGRVLAVPAPGDVAPPAADEDAEPTGEGDPDTTALSQLDATVLVPTESGPLPVTGRLLEGIARAADGRMSVRREHTPADVPVGREVDGVLRVWRDPPRPDLARHVRGEDAVAVARRADAAPAWVDPAAGEALTVVAEQSWVLPLYEVPVAHVWDPDLTGIVPSAWPGTGLSSAVDWVLEPRG